MRNDHSPDLCSVDAFAEQGSAPENKSYSRPTGKCHFSGTLSNENQPSYALTSGLMRKAEKKACSRGRRKGM